MQEVTGSIPVVSTKKKKGSPKDSPFSFCCRQPNRTTPPRARRVAVPFAPYSRKLGLTVGANIGSDSSLHPCYYSSLNSSCSLCRLRRFPVHTTIFFTLTGRQWAPTPTTQSHLQSVCLRAINDRPYVLLHPCYYSTQSILLTFTDRRPLRCCNSLPLIDTTPSL